MNDEEYMQRLGLKIKVLRSLKKMSQDDVVNRLNIDKSYYSKVERGLTNPALLYLRHLAEIFDVDLSKLINADLSL